MLLGRGPDQSYTPIVLPPIQNPPLKESNELIQHMSPSGEEELILSNTHKDNNEEFEDESTATEISDQNGYLPIPTTTLQPLPPISQTNNNTQQQGTPSSPSQPTWKSDDSTQTPDSPHSSPGVARQIQSSPSSLHIHLPSLPSPFTSRKKSPKIDKVVAEVLKSKSIRLFVGTWNMEGKPPPPGSLSPFITAYTHHVYAIGTYIFAVTPPIIYLEHTIFTQDLASHQNEAEC